MATSDELLQKLEERFILGEISEETYKDLKAKLLARAVGSGGPPPATASIGESAVVKEFHQEQHTDARSAGGAAIGGGITFNMPTGRGSGGSQEPELAYEETVLTILHAGGRLDVARGRLDTRRMALGLSLRMAREIEEACLAAAGVHLIAASTPPSAAEPPPPHRPAPAASPRPGEILTNSIGMKLALIPAGTFMMGSPGSEPDRFDDETLHRVALTRGFYMGTTPVTQAQWEAVMGSNPSGFKGPTLPVETVSWDDVVQFCEALSAREGKSYRLPTEAEWEYACRAGSPRPYGGTGRLDDMAWYADNSGDARLDSRKIWDTAQATYGEHLKKNRCRTHSVGQKRPNAWGLYDMHGNVWEWCADRYGEYAGDETDPTGSSDGTARVLRGGSWVNDPQGCRSAYRVRSEPGYRDYSFGFRVALDFQ